MRIKKFYLGIYMTCCYLYWDEKRTGYLFDCGGTDLEDIVEFVEKENIRLEYLVLTHGHGDHIGGINRIIELYPEIKVYIGEEEKEFLTDSKLSLSREISGIDFKFKGTYNTLKEGDHIGEFKVIDTPGHTIGSKCFYSEKAGIMFTGDTLFRRSFGRYDLPTGNPEVLFKSLEKLINSYPADTKVFSGHSEETTLGEEKTFLKSQQLI